MRKSWPVPRAGEPSYHLCGTCKMGLATSRASVVDDRLRVHGIVGFSVADTSSMPEIVSGNTDATSIMIGEKAASMIQEENMSRS
jgi:choline dehydrogenase